MRLRVRGLEHDFTVGAWRRQQLLRIAVQAGSLMNRLAEWASKCDEACYTSTVVFDESRCESIILENVL
jgi:hypothetical protein